MRSTTRQSSSRPVQVSTARHRWDRRILFSLRIALASATVVVTYAVLTQDPAHAEMRWLLAFLATALFLVALVESETVRRETTKDETADRNLTAQDVESYGEATAKLNQLAKHRTDYVYTMSHELRTPLTSIRGFAEMLAKDVKIPVAAEAYASTIVQESDRLAKIIDDIIELTRMESTLLDLRREPVPIADLLREIAGQLRSRDFPDRLRLDVPATMSWVRGDEGRLAQLLERLILDAISRTDPREPITLSARDGQGFVTIRLRYAASAEQANRMARALNGLWQCGGDDHATRLGQGELGLYIARNLIEAHGGRVSIEAGLSKVAISIDLPC